MRIVSRRFSAGCRALAVIGLIMTGSAASAQDRTDREPSGVLRLLPDAVETRHAVDLPGGRLEYRTRAGTLPLLDGKGATTAEIFYVAHTLNPADVERPVTFVFNGGPGAASAFLHLGAIGPRAIALAPDGEVPPPPARLVDNPDTWLGLTDLVFVDPVGTGYSRTPEPDQASTFWGVDQDANAMAAFIRLYLARSDRTTSPVFLVGESYGGFRAAVLAHQLQSETGVVPSGVVMISPALEFALVRSADDYQPLNWALQLPSFAAVKLEREGVRGADALAARLTDVEHFALSEYLLDLADGIAAEPGTVAAVSRYTGLDPEIVEARSARIPVPLFIKELARAEARVLSRYDGRVAGPDPEPEDPEPSAPDAVLSRLTPALTSAFVRYVREELGYRTDVTYRLLGGEISGRWDYSTTPQRQGYAGALEDLQYARALNPAMQVMIAHGYTDLVTPYFATKYLLSQLPPLAGAAPVDLRLYEVGHMMYMRPASRQKLREDVQGVYERAARASQDP